MAPHLLDSLLYWRVVWRLQHVTGRPKSLTCLLSKLVGLLTCNETVSALLDAVPVTDCAPLCYGWVLVPTGDPCQLSEQGAFGAKVQSNLVCMQAHQENCQKSAS